MTVHYLNGRHALDRRSPEHRAMVAAGLWLRAGFVALSVEVIALIMLAVGEATPWVAIAGAIVAGVIARWSWHKARAALDVEAAESGGNSPPAAPVGTRVDRFGGPVELPLSR